MSHGKKVCKILKEIRQQIAEKNDIALIISECHFQGECKGTCPKCEAEVKYLEKELNNRRQLGKAVVIAGISLGMAGTFTGCGTPIQESTQTPEREVFVNLIEIPDSLTNIPPPPLLCRTIGFIPPEITATGMVDGNIDEEFPIIKDTVKLGNDIELMEGIIILNPDDEE